LRQPAREAVSETDPALVAAFASKPRWGYNGWGRRWRISPGSRTVSGQGGGAPHQVDRPCARNRRGVSEAVSRGWGASGARAAMGGGGRGWLVGRRQGQQLPYCRGRAEEGPEQGWITRG
jgi:hypothetical protein